MSGFIVTGKDGVTRPLRPEDFASRNATPSTSVSETWSVNSNNPRQIHYNRTVTQAREYYRSPAEYQNWQRRMNEWLAAQWQLTQPVKKPTLGNRIYTLGQNISRAVKAALG